MTGLSRSESVFRKSPVRGSRDSESVTNVRSVPALPSLRRALEKTVKDARLIAEEGTSGRHPPPWHRG